MENRIFINPRSKQKKLNVTNFKDEWVYQAHESADNLPHMIEYVNAENYRKAIAALKAIATHTTSNMDVVIDFCNDTLRDLNE